MEAGFLPTTVKIQKREPRKEGTLKYEKLTIEIELISTGDVSGISNSQILHKVMELLKLV
jgi:hypothetical protein